MHRPRQGLGAAAWVFPVLATALGLYWRAFQPAIEFLQPDSGTYIAGVAIRGTLYPALVGWVGQAALPDFQLALYFGAAALAAWRLACVFDSPAAGLFYLVFVGANPELVKYCFTVLSEAPSFAAGMLLMAAATSAAEGRPAGLVAMGLIVGISIDFRPANWSWAPLVPLAALLGRTGWRVGAAGLAALALPLVVLAMMPPPGAAAAKREFAALNLFGKFALLPGEPQDAFQARVAAETALMRTRLDTIEDFDLAFALRALYAEHLRYGVWNGLAAEALPGAGTHERFAAVLDFARTRPLAYATEIGRQLRGFWTLPDLMTAPERARRAAALAALPESSLRAFEALPAARSTIAVWSVRAVLAVGFVATLAWIAAAPFGGPAAAFAGLAALALWGNWTLIAGLHTALPRYALGAWPFLGVCLAASIAVANRIWRSRKRP